MQKRKGVYVFIKAKKKDVMHSEIIPTIKHLKQNFYICKKNQ